MSDMDICIKIFIANKERVLNIFFEQSIYSINVSKIFSLYWDSSEKIICFIHYIVTAALNPARLRHGHVGTASRRTRRRSIYF